MPAHNSGARNARPAAAPPSGPGRPQLTPRPLSKWRHGAGGWWERGSDGTGRAEGKGDGELRACGENGARPGFRSPGGARPEARPRGAGAASPPGFVPEGRAVRLASERRLRPEVPRAHSRDSYARDKRAITAPHGGVGYARPIPSSPIYPFPAHARAR